MPDPAAEFEPKIVAFFCNWCTYTAADLAGISRMRYAPNVRVVRVMCSGRVDPQFVLDAFANGADGVLIGGCHPGDCHYQNGNDKALRRVRLLRRILQQMGVEEARFRLEWISASEGDKVRAVVNQMVEEVRALGPARLGSADSADFRDPQIHADVPIRRFTQIHADSSTQSADLHRFPQESAESQAGETGGRPATDCGLPNHSDKKDTRS